MTPEQKEWVAAYEAEEVRMRREYMAIVAAMSSDTELGPLTVASPSLSLWLEADKIANKFDHSGGRNG
jgi:hypothetical protein